MFRSFSLSLNVTYSHDVTAFSCHPRPTFGGEFLDPLGGEVLDPLGGELDVCFRNEQAKFNAPSSASLPASFRGKSET